MSVVTEPRLDHCSEHPRVSPALVHRQRDAAALIANQTAMSPRQARNLACIHENRRGKSWHRENPRAKEGGRLLRCGTCKHHKPVSEFHVNSRTRDGRAQSCKACVSAYMKVYNRTRRVSRGE